MYWQRREVSHKNIKIYIKISSNVEINKILQLTNIPTLRKLFQNNT
jgi:hypothetical protein